MGTSTYFYIGTFIKINKGFTVDEKVSVRKCPNCHKNYGKDVQFCPVDGAKIETEFKTVGRRIEKNWEILSHIEQDSDDLTDMLMATEYGPNVILSNGNLYYTKMFNSDDEVLISSESLYKDRQFSINEFKTAYQVILDKLSELGVDYELVHGITMVEF